MYDLVYFSALKDPAVASGIQKLMAAGILKVA